jgi:hypothetical protein
MQQVGLGGAIKNDMWITDLEESPDPKSTSQSYRDFMYWFAPYQ